MEVFIFITWLVLSGVAANIAGNKGRSAGGVLCLSLILSPLVGLIVAFSMAPNATAVEAGKVASGESKKCPFCAEVIKYEALVCRFCGKDQPASEKSSNDSNVTSTQTPDEVAFQKFKADLIAADQRKSFWAHERLAFYGDEWWRREFQAHQGKTKSK